MSEASIDEIKSEIEERKSENPLAYPENKYGYDLDVKVGGTTAGGKKRGKK